MTTYSQTPTSTFSPVPQDNQQNIQNQPVGITDGNGKNIENCNRYINDQWYHENSLEDSGDQYEYSYLIRGLMFICICGCVIVGILLYQRYFHKGKIVVNKDGKIVVNEAGKQVRRPNEKWTWGVMQIGCIVCAGCYILAGCIMNGLWIYYRSIFPDVVSAGRPCVDPQKNIVSK
jgi:hypothetical protein